MQTATPNGIDETSAPRRCEAEGGSRSHSTSALPWVLLLAAGTAAAQGAPSAVPRAAVGGRDMGIPFANLSCVAVNPRHGEILAADQGRGEIATFDTLGVPLGFFVHSVPGPDGAPRDGRPAFLAVDGDGRLLVSDLEAPFVDVLDVRGRSLGRLELPGDSLDFGDGPGAIAVGPDGRIFVASRGHRGRIHVFGPDHAHRGSWGEAGQDSARIADVTGLAVDARHRVWIACASTRLCVQVFDDAGRFAFGFGLHDMGPRNFSLPSGIALTSDGRVWVGDGIRHIVQVFDSQGTHLGPIGGLGNGPGDLQYPCALATDGRDLLVVAERVGKRFQVWRTR